MKLKIQIKLCLLKLSETGVEGCDLYCLVQNIHQMMHIETGVEGCDLYCLVQQELEKEAEKLSQTHEKLRITECEVQTLKSYLTSKTAIVERHKKELRESRMKVTELEEKDNRRAVILADVLEKTARQYQQQLTATAPPTVKVTSQPLLSSER